MIISISDTRCNKCGEKLDAFDISGDYSIHKTIGYGSKYDGDRLGLTLCSKCLDELIESCKITPITEVL